LKFKRLEEKRPELLRKKQVARQRKNFSLEDKKCIICKDAKIGNNK
jgi:hypothetical protein